MNSPVSPPSGSLAPELLIPAGNLSKLRTALAYGADAVYVGACGLSMRPDAASLAPDALAEAAELTQAQSRRLYVAVNTMLFNEDLSALEAWIEATRQIRFDAVIVSDVGAFSLLKEKRPDVRLHISTQAGTANARSAAFWQQAGAHRVVLARECTLQHAREIAGNNAIEVEIFVHGAMCVAISGRCLLSAHLCGKSGGRGECKHSCRWEWQLVEQKRPGAPLSAFETGRETILLGSTDLCLMEHLPTVIRAGVRSLKVEGRMKSESYVATVTRVYRAALDRYVADPGRYTVDPVWMAELESVSHRPYATGFAFGYPSNEPACLQAENQVISTHEVLGYVECVENGRHTVSARNIFTVGEHVEWIGPGSSGGTVQIERLTDKAGKALSKSHCGTRIDTTFAADIILPEHSVLRRRR